MDAELEDDVVLAKDSDLSPRLEAESPDVRLGVEEDEDGNVCEQGFDLSPRPEAEGLCVPGVEFRVSDEVLGLGVCSFRVFLPPMLNNFLKAFTAGFDDSELDDDDDVVVL